MDASSPILQLKGVQFSIGSSRLFEDVDCVVQPGARICLVGRNGTGKSTLFRLISGQIEADLGDVILQPGIRITHMQQDPLFPKDSSALAYVCDQDEANEHEAKRLLDALGMPYDKKLDELSGGQARRVSLAHALVSQPDLLLLDEPTNHLDLATIEWLEGTMLSYPGSFIVISHDRAFLNKVTNETLWLDQKRVRRLRKGYKDFPEWSELILEEEARASIKLDKKIEAESEWASGGIKARRKRNQGRLRKLHDMRATRAQHIRAVKMARLEAGAKELTSRAIIDAQGISKAYDETPIIESFTTRILHGDRIGIVGPNGAGKTTLLKMFTGHLKPDSGRLKLAKNLQIAYLDQNRQTLDPDKTMIETLCPGGGDMVEVMGKHRHVIAYLKDFLFHPDQARSPVRVLSGGEKNRLLLAMSLAQDSNMLILDEPTNDLDMDTLDRLQDMLMNYEGTLLVVSHDRDFLDNLVSSTIVLEGDGLATEYAGGYSDYIEQKKGQKKKAAKSEKKKAEKKKPEAKKPSKPKLSFKDQYALKTLPDEIAKIEQTIESLATELNDPNIYTNNPQRAADLAKQLADLRDKKEALEHRWLELELLQDSL